MNTRVTVQNGANHGLSRRETERLLRHIPASWCRDVTTVAISEHAEPAFSCAYFAKEKTLGVFWPSARYLQPTKVEAAEAVLVAISIVAERGELPKRIGSSLHSDHRKRTADLLRKYLNEMEGHAT